MIAFIYQTREDEIMADKCNKYHCNPNPCGGGCTHCGCNCGGSEPADPTPDPGLGFGSLRGTTIEVPGAELESMPFNLAGPLSDTVTVSQSGNGLVVGESGVYQISLSVSAEATAEPDADQPYLTALITVNGDAAFGDISTYFMILNRSSSTFVVQAALSAGDEVGAGISSNFFPLGYMNRSLSIVKLSN